MKALMVVAHPDDCCLFGYHLWERYKDWDWRIAYLTYDDRSDRVVELRRFCKKRGVGVKGLGFQDQWEYVSQGLTGFDELIAREYLIREVDGSDIIMTHNAAGEYGHPHHLFIHGVLKDVTIPKIYFGNYPDLCNLIIRTDEDTFDPAELPMHEEVCRGFDRKLSKYLITPEAQELLNCKHE